MGTFYTIHIWQLLRDPPKRGRIIVPHVVFPSKIALIGNYLPRLCGIATFTYDLQEALSIEAPGVDCYVGALNDLVIPYNYSEQVRFEIQEKELDSYRRAADFLNFNNADVLCLQHEFGIFGGRSGAHILALLKEVRMPIVTTLHTVLKNPDTFQRNVMEEVVSRSDRLVVMTERGSQMLSDIYKAPKAKIDIIPHGIPDMPFKDSAMFKAQFGIENRTVLLTFGLIGPSKGIEYVIRAMPKIIAKHPNVVYLVLGSTHPNLKATEGERYRLNLEQLADELGVKEHVIFYNRFVSLHDLKEFIGATDIYITPYINEEQVTSGTLAYVYGAGKVVVSTPYWHAQELLANDRGVLVPFRDSEAISNAVGKLLDNPETLKKIQIQAYLMGRKMIWAEAAKGYLDSFRHACADHKVAPRTAFAKWTLANRPSELPLLKLQHVHHMTDGTGIFQHAIYNIPNFHEGYCIDDNARAFILCNLLEEIGGNPPPKNLSKLTSCYLAFMNAAFNHKRGRFRNFMSHSREWLEDQGSEDSHGRALWATGLGAGRSKVDGFRKLSSRLFELGLPKVVEFSSPRAWAFTLLGLNEYRNFAPLTANTNEINTFLVSELMRLWKNCSTQDWPWFESCLTYENARFCEALIVNGEESENTDILATGLKSLEWLVSIQTTRSGNFRPIGSNGFYQQNGFRADFDQQPVEAQAMVSACLEAFRVTQNTYWSKEAKRAFDWFLGRNDLGLALYDFSTGGCSDGLHSDRISENQGAESTLAFHLALTKMKGANVTNAPTLASS